jgi:hypothetical protein
LITVEDRTAIGAIVTSWASAESEFELLIGILSHNDVTSLQALAPQRLVSFEKKVDLAKKLIKLTCQDHPDFVDASRDLFSNGKRLANERKIAAHWRATRVAQYPGLSFLDLGLPWAVPSGVTWQDGDLVSLAEDIGRWEIALMRFRFLLTWEGGPLASIQTLHGPKPEQAPLELSDCHTTLKKRPTPTKRT